MGPTFKNKTKKESKDLLIKHDLHPNCIINSTMQVKNYLTCEKE